MTEVRYCYGCYRDTAKAPGKRYTLAGYLLCNAGCISAGLARWWKR